MPTDFVGSWLLKLLALRNLDELVRGEHLDYFILYSSITTLIGNPGQGNYVAANAYMEGLARRRRQKGLPALAIGWGPIADVGIVAQNPRLQSGLQKLGGFKGISAREALALLEQALELPAGNASTAVMTICPIDGSFGSGRLAVLRSPTYAAYVNGGHGRDESAEGSIDLHAVAAKDGVETARRRAIDLISAQLAHVLHLRKDDISQVRPLAEIGLDSLMALELVMKLEDRLGIHMPLTGASGGMTIIDIADQVMAIVGLDRDPDDAVVAALAEQHHTEVEPAQLRALKNIKGEDFRTPKRLRH